MLVTFISILIITLVCYSWGDLFFGKRIFANSAVLAHPAIISLAGLMMVSMTATILSLFLPLGTLWIKALFLLPLIWLIYQKGIQVLVSPFRTLFSGFSIGAWILFSALLLMALILSAPPIIHPDTLGYHAPLIKWIETNKAVPGIVHLQPRLGLQNSWFVSIALLDLFPSKGNGLLFLPVTLLSWYFLFLIDHINRAFLQKDLSTLLGWMAWLGISLFPITLVRLTAASTHPDFMAVLVCWVIFWLLSKRKVENELAVHALIILFGFYALTIKWSVLPIMVLALYSFTRLSYRSVPKTLYVSFIALLLLGGTLARNTISSGYPFFPTDSMDWVNVDWKPPKSELLDMQDYVTGYARGYRDGNTQEAMNGSNARFQEWIPVWWKHLTMPDKVMMVLTLAALLFSLIRLQSKKFREEFGRLWLVSFTGLLFWWFIAPDPRFGYAFITGLILAAFSGKIPLPDIKWVREKSSFLLVLPAILIILYSGYRGWKDQVYQHTLLPAGPFMKNTGQVIEKEGRKWYRPLEQEGCSWNLLPCTPDEMEGVEFRGEELEDGFKRKF